MKTGSKSVKTMVACTALFAMTLVGCGAQNTSSAAPASSQTATTTSSQSTTQTAATTAPSLKAQEINLTVLPGGRLGSDGKMHDTFSPANFSVVQGVPVKLTVYNYDGGGHTVTNSDLGLNLIAQGSKSKGVPGVTSVTFTPTKAGDFQWKCLLQCDGSMTSLAMTTPGYMQGTIHVVPNTTPQQFVTLNIKDGVQFAVKDGKLHDSFTPADFTVQAGIPVTVTVENFDGGQHTLTAPDLGVNETFKGAAKDGEPSVSTFTFTPTKAGDFQWKCLLQCDGSMTSLAMTTPGYMQGTIHVVQ